MDPHLSISQGVVDVLVNSVDAKKLERLVHKHPGIARVVAQSFEKMAEECEAEDSIWGTRKAPTAFRLLTNEYSQKATLLRSMLARQAAHATMAAMLKGLGS